MSGKKKESLFILSYSGSDTAENAYEALRGMEKDKQVDIKTAMVVYRKDNGKLKLKHKRRLTVKKGMVAGGALGLLIGAAAAPALVGGAVLGGLVGMTRSKQRRDLKGFLEDKLGPDDSALAVLIKEADWAAVDAKMDPYGGETLVIELTDEDAAAVEAMATDDEVASSVEGEVEVVEDDDVEVVEDDEAETA